MIQYETGEQPCRSFKPERVANEYAEWNNTHECPKCGKTRSLCVHCYKDHHEDGWETCGAKIKDTVRLP